VARTRDMLLEHDSHQRAKRDEGSADDFEAILQQEEAVLQEVGESALRRFEEHEEEMLKHDIEMLEEHEEWLMDEAHDEWFWSQVDAYCNLTPEQAELEYGPWSDSD